MAPDRSGDRGFILATTLLVMTVLAVMLTAVFITVSAEFRSTNSSYSLTRSLNLAQAGLSTYFSSTHALNSATDSTNYAFSGGYARVVARRLRDTTGTTRELWMVYATGVDTTRKLLATGGGSRTVASLAYRTGQVPARAAMVAANGITVSAGLPTDSNPLYGKSAHIGSYWVIGCSDPPPPSLPNPALDTVAVTTGPSGYTPSTGLDPIGRVEPLGSVTAVTDSTSIDWARIVVGGLTPDHTGVLPADCYGTSAVCPYDSFYYSGSVTIPASGGTTSKRGLLIATGNVTMALNSHWDGIIIAGGQFVANASNYKVHGMVISGMNCATGACPAKNTVQRNGVPQIMWDWCYAHAALSGFASLAPISGTFMDTWKTY